MYIWRHLDNLCLDVLGHHNMIVHYDDLVDYISANQDQHMESIDWVD